MASDNFVDNTLLCGVTHDLAEELFHFANRRPWQSGLYSKLLVKADDLRVLLVAMDAGAVMKEHHTDGTTTIHVLQGVLCIRIQEKPQALQVGQVLTLAPRTKHDIEARDDSAFLVTISWPTTETLQSLPHRGYGS
ncbi:MAG: AraC family ligand binding domain-containing protein [Acidobacteriales bacterium]|nr:AraC family ligand binding domain-containing protein [Terriglobales bacterium]